jgi:hypothetical protein
MNEVDKALGIDGPPFPFKVNGKTYLLAPGTIGMQAECVKRLKEMARAEYEELKPGVLDAAVTPAERHRYHAEMLKYIEAKDDYHAHCLAGKYKWGGKIMTEALSSLQSGMVCFLFWLMLKVHQPDISFEEAEHVFMTHPEDVTETLKEMASTGKTRSPEMTATTGTAQTTA